MNELPKNITDGFLSDPADLSQLKIIDADKVKTFVDELNSISDDDLKGRKLVAAIGTGGTISMRVEDGLRIPDLNFEEVFSQANSHLNELFKVVSLDAFRIDSSQMHYGHVRDMAIALAYTWKNLKTSIIGFLIPHGTDTLSYAASAMSLVMGQGLPFSIVYTGAQKSIQEPMNDAGVNLRNALFTLEAMHEQDMAEVVTVMGNRALLSTSAVKVNDQLTDAFDSPIHQYVSTFSALEYPVRLAEWLSPRRDLHFMPTIWDGDYGHTLIIQSNMGINPEVYAEQLKNPNIRAVLLFSYGAGTVYEGMSKAILGPAKDKNCPVFVVSPVNARYKIAYQSAKQIIEKGAVPLYMTLPAALAKIEIALRMHPEDTDAVSRFMTLNYVGEIPSEGSRFRAVLKR